MLLQDKIQNDYSFYMNHVLPNQLEPISGRSYSHLIVRKLTQEAILLTLTKIVLDQIASLLLVSYHPIVRNHVWNRIVWQPTGEEIVFRGAILGGLKLYQNWHNQRKASTTERELRIQQTFRVCIVGVLFGVAHLTNGNSFGRGLLQGSVNVWQGISYGFIWERTHTLSLPILAHAFPNVISILQKNELLSPLQAHLCVAVYGLGLAVLVWPCSSSLTYRLNKRSGSLF